MLLIIGVTAASFLLWPALGSELFPNVDAGTFEIRIKTLPGTKLEETETLVAEIETTIQQGYAPTIWIDPKTGVDFFMGVQYENNQFQSLMGTLMMIGVVVNNSILLVEFANRQLQQGKSARDAALSAAQVRLRPISMTSLTLVASMLPLSMHLLPGNEAMIPLARALLGGIVISTLLTLILVPCIYCLVHSRKPTVPAA